MNRSPHRVSSIAYIAAISASTFGAGVASDHPSAPDTAKPGGRGTKRT